MPARDARRSLLMSVAIAADALINAVVLLFDPAVEARGGRALGRAWMSYRSFGMLLEET